MYLEVKLQMASCHKCIYKLKCHKIGTNDVFKDKQETKKVPLLSLELGMHKLRYNRQD